MSSFNTSRYYLRRQQHSLRQAHDADCSMTRNIYNRMADRYAELSALVEIEDAQIVPERAHLAEQKPAGDRKRLLTSR